MGKSQISQIEETLLFHIRAIGLPEPEREFHFSEDRGWRFDFAYPARRIAIECEGGTRSGGRHVRGQGYEEDCRKYNAAVLDGWQILRFTGAMIEDGTAFATIERALSQQ